MPIRTLVDGRKVNIPEGMGDAEAENLVLATFPDLAASLGMSPDIEREYDITSGVGDLSARWGNALAAGEPEEVRAEFDKAFGKGNWGISPIGNEPYVTPEGLRRIGIEPKDERKVLLDGIGTDLYDLVDIAPEAIVGAASVAAELIPIPGTGTLGAGAARGMLSALTGRGLVARSARAGAGDAAANVGLEGVQALRGTNRETIGEILQDAGTEGLIVGLGSIALGAPFSAVGNVAGRIKSVAKDLPAGQQGISEVTLDKILEARARVAGQLGEEDAFLPTMKTLSTEGGGVGSQIAAKIEGSGFKQSGDEYMREMTDLINKYRGITLDSARAGDDELTTLAKLSDRLTAREKEISRKIVDNLENFKRTPLGQVDEAAKSVRGMKDYIQSSLSQNYKIGQKVFDGPNYYGSPILKQAGEVTLTPQRVANLIQRVANEAQIADVDQVLASFGDLGARIRSRVNIKRDGRVVPVKNTKKYIGSDITAQNFMDAERALRTASYKARGTNYEQVARNLDISSAISNQVSNLPELSTTYRRELARVNSAYKQFVSPYRGKNGLFKQLAERSQDDATAYLNSFVRGKEGAEFSTIVKQLEQAFGPNAVGSKEAGFLGLSTKDEILGSIGVNYLREGKVGLSKNLDLGLEQGKREANRQLTALSNLEATLEKRIGSAGAAKAVKEIFGLDTIKEYKKILNAIKNGTPDEVANAQAKAGMIMSFKEAQAFVANASKIGDKLANSNLDEVAQQLARLRSLDPKAAEYYQDLLFSENWSKLLAAASKTNANEKNAAIKGWSDDWLAASTRLGNDANMKAMFGDQLYNGMNDLALSIRGASNIDPASGALSVAAQPFIVLQSILRRNFAGAAKPVSFMYVLKNTAPGTPAWKKLVKSQMNGSTVEKSTSNVSKDFKKIIGNSQDIADRILSGRNGFLAASVSAYMEEANMIYPTDEDVPVVQPTKITQEERQAVEPQQPTQEQIANDIGASIVNLINSSRSLEGIGTGGLEEGARIAAGR